MLHLHPTRLAGALVGICCVAVSIALTAACAQWLGMHAGLLPEVLGGIVALNTLLFFPPGTLTDHPSHLLPALAVNILPIMATVLLFQVQPVLADIALIATAVIAVLARASGPMHGVLALIAALNVVITLVLGAGFPMLLLAPLAGIIGSAIALCGDIFATRLERGLGLRAEQALLVNTAAEFLDAVASRLRQPQPWEAGWFLAYRKRVRAILADMALAFPSDPINPAQAPDHLVAAIAACADGLHRLRQTTPPALASTVDATLNGVAVALRGRANERGILLAQELLGAARPDGTTDSKAAGQAFGLGLLLRDFVPAVLNPVSPPAPALAPAHGRPGRTEFRQAAQVATALAIALLVAHVTDVPRPYWIPLTTLIVAGASFGESALKAAERLLGTVAGLLVGQIAWMLSHERPNLMTTTIALAVFGVFLCRTGPYRWILFWITVAVSGLLHLVDAGASSYLARLADTIIGAAIAVAVGWVLLPMRTQQSAHARLREYLAAVANQLRNTAHMLSSADATPATILFDRNAARALAALQGLADAEIIEAAIDSTVRSRVRRRLAAANRLARCLVSLQAILDKLTPVTDPTIAAQLGQLADAASGSAPPPAPDLHPIQSATRSGDPTTTEQAATRLRLARLLSAAYESVCILRDDPVDRG